ncbi:protein Simiate [Rhopalosiphum maidis]|uniref:protein Simiate n=1 Tax=Rhopalosiphum maidis TaxID=43146 RepID=UPI000EFE726A|nr:protein Simiate [Rhopalosiphum maidis]
MIKMEKPNVYDFSIDDDSVPSIEQSVEISEDVPPTVVQRYFESRYATNVNDKPNQDYSVLIHSNNLCILSLASSHVLMGKTIEKIDFQVSENTHRLSNIMTGKGKRGAQIVQAGSTLCKVYCSDGEEHKILSAIPGKLVEMNSKLAETPNIMLNKPDDLGFIAIVLPQKQRFEKIRDGLLTKEQYIIKNSTV